MPYETITNCDICSTRDVKCVDFIKWKPKKHFTMNNELDYELVHSLVCEDCQVNETIKALLGVWEAK